ncbi:related to Chromatin-remodeling complex subunit IES6 [Zygosaccharomyces bailii]|nr:related to Chromatin-remodeling complex subunit IES6 [Zygosaccharomyces bailii]
MSVGPNSSNNNGSAERLEFLRSVSNRNSLPVPSPFKKPNYRKPTRRHKSARQLVVDESKRINAILQVDPNNKPVPKVTYFNVNAPPSLKPHKKYCDITGLKSLYRSPVNNMRYYNAEVYQLVVKPMAPGVDQEYLKLRGDHFVLK